MQELTPAVFRGDFPEFASQTVFPDSMITYWCLLANTQINQAYWDVNLIKAGQENYIAHNCVLEAAAQGEVNYKNLPGVSKGIIASQGIDKLSESYDGSGTIEKDAGYWNLTVYGTRFFHLVQMMGMGPLQF